jgi:hypothetical protein
LPMTLPAAARLPGVRSRSPRILNDMKTPPS